jgi:hypothetical protein
MTATQQKIELMQIATMDDLNAEIARVRSRLALQQEVLKLRMKELPKEILKASAIAIVPGFLAARISKRGFGVASGLLGWLFHKKEDKKSEAKKKVVKQAKQVGVYTGLGFLFNTLRKKFLS